MSGTYSTWLSCLGPKAEGSVIVPLMTAVISFPFPIVIDVADISE